MSGLGLSASLQMGARALNAYRIAVEVAGNNLANANTPGYARQKAVLSSDVTLPMGVGFQGTGVQVTQIESVRDRLLDNYIVRQKPLSGYYATQSQLGSMTQTALGESLDTSATASATATDQTVGIQGDLNRFFGSLQGLSSTPSSTVARSGVLETGKALAQDLNSASTRLQNLQSDMATQAGAVTDQINQLSTEIAGLNKQIFQTEVGGVQKANDLRDSRQADIEALGNLVNINATEQSTGMVDINLADAPSVNLVLGVNGGGSGSTESLSLGFNKAANPPLTVSASVSGNLGGATPSSGELGAYLRMVNEVIGSPAAVGNTGLLGNLDTLALNLVSQMNTQHAAGYDLNGNPGGAFFNAATTGAGDIQVASAVAADSSLIAAGDGSGALSGTNAVAMAALGDNANIGPAYRSIVSGLGSTLQLSQQQEAAQKVVQDQANTMRGAISGVSMDEEITNLTSFQRAYEASSRFISVVDQMLDKLVNGTGVH